MWSPLAEHPAPSLHVLESWLDEHNVIRHRALKVERMEDSSGLRVVSKQQIPLGTVLCSVSKSSIFSHQTASFSTICPPLHQLNSNHAILYLTTCLLHELKLGKESKLYGWMQILPRETILLPTFWGDRELVGEDGILALEWIKGTEAERELNRKEREGFSLDDLTKYYKAYIPHLPPTAEHPDPSPLTSFLHTFSLISTRSFVIDNYHTIGMVPFCDLFNHSSKAHSSLLSDACVCSTCGSLDRCSHDTLSAEGEVDRIRHLPAGYIDKMQDDGSDSTVDMRVERMVLACEEVTSCYQEDVGDGKLLVEWGFVGGQDSGDGLVWSPRDLLDGTTARIFMELLQRGHLYQGIASGQDGIVGSGSEYQFGLLNLSPDGRVSINIISAVYLSYASEQADIDDIEELENGIINIVKEIRAVWSKTERPSQLSSACKAMIHRILLLLDQRVATMHHPDLSLDELHSIKNNLPVDAPLQKLALKIAIQERSLLSRTRQQWHALLFP